MGLVGCDLLGEHLLARVRSCEKKEGVRKEGRTEMCPARIKNTRMSGVLHKQTQHTNTTISEIHCMHAQHNSRENHSCGIE